jgi:hypothetical protein
MNPPEALELLTLAIGGRHFGLFIGEFHQNADKFTGHLVHLLFRVKPPKDTNGHKRPNGVPVKASINNTLDPKFGNFSLRYLGLAKKLMIPDLQREG